MEPVNLSSALTQLGQAGPTGIAAALLVIFLAIGIHEYCHAKFADMAGDPTPGIYGRVTLNLFKHFDPVGTIFILITVFAGFGIGWGKPVPMDPRKMRNPKWDHFTAVLAGPMSNIVQAVVWALIFRGVLAVAPGVFQSGTVGEFFALFLLFGVSINIGLFLFNLLPIGPLDGMWILGTFLPEKSRWAWTKWNLTAGQFVFLGLILLGPMIGINIVGGVIGPIMVQLRQILVGM